MENTITLVSFLAFTGLVAGVTYWITRKSDHSTNDGYFLAGRKLTFPVIAGSLLLTNLSTEQMVGLNGSAFSDGLSVMAWEVLAVVALVAMAIFFLPYFLRSGITTLPQFLEERFDHGTQVVTNLVFLFAYATILLPIILFTGAVGLMDMLNIPGLIGIENPTVVLWLIVWVVGIIGTIYAVFGGLSTITVSDTLNGIGLLIGGLLISYFGLQAVSGNEGVFAGLETLQREVPEKLNSIGQHDQEVPFSTLFTGVLIINLFYWCTNQQIIQRTFGASSLAEGQKGVLLTGGLKLIGPLYLVLPGIMAFYLYADQGVTSNRAYGTLVNNVLPSPLTGFFAAVLMGAILSSFNSALNATATLYSIGLYKAVLRKDATDPQVVKSGKWFGIIMAVIAMSIAPLLQGQDSIFAYLQKMNGIYFIPIFALVIVGILARRVPPIAAKVALIVGIAVIAIGYFVPPFNGWVSTINDFHFLGIVFASLVVLMLVIGKVKPAPAAWVQADAKCVDMTPWKLAKPVSAALIVIVIAIYAFFADFSPEASPDTPAPPPASAVAE